MSIFLQQLDSCVLITVTKIYHDFIENSKVLSKQFNLTFPKLIYKHLIIYDGTANDAVVITYYV